MSATQPERPNLTATGGAAHRRGIGGSLRRRASGGFGTVLPKGDAEQGALMLVRSAAVAAHVACLERVLAMDGGPTLAARWPGAIHRRISEGISDFLAKRARFDPDLWVWNWISRTLNGSSLKRPVRVDPTLRRGNSLNNKSGGHLLWPSPRMPRETGRLHEGRIA